MIYIPDWTERPDYTEESELDKDTIMDEKYHANKDDNAATEEWQTIKEDGHINV